MALDIVSILKSLEYMWDISPFKFNHTLFTVNAQDVLCLRISFLLLVGSLCMWVQIIIRTR